jgi:DNA-binding transcriptional ArsR family regulator
MASGRLTAAQRAKVFKALSDSHRLAIVDSLAKNGARCGTELADELGISLALVSHHWEVLVDAGLIRKERVGQARYCSLDIERLREATGGWGDAALEPVAPPPPAKKRATKPKRAAKRRASPRD